MGIKVSVSSGLMSSLAFAVYADTISAPAARSRLLALAPLAAAALASAAQAALAVGTRKELRDSLIGLLDARHDSAVALAAVLVATFLDAAAVGALRVGSALPRRRAGQHGERE